MIKIEKPFIVVDDSFATLQTYITIDENRRLIWFRVKRKWEQYLCDERADAFVIAILNYAIRNRHDIISDAPISEDLYYNIDTYLIDALVEYNPLFYRTKISADYA